MNLSDKCPNCGKPATSINESGNKRFYNHGEGGSMKQEHGQIIEMKFDGYCAVEMKRYPKSAGRLDGHEVYADKETERKLESVGFIRAEGAPYYSYKWQPIGPEVVIYDDGTWNVLNGFLPNELENLKSFHGMSLNDFANWMKSDYEEMRRKSEEGVGETT